MPLMIRQNHFHHQGNLFINNFFVIIIFLFFQYPQYIETMRVHPMANKRNASLRDDPDLNSMGGNSNKKLRRLPHVFSKVLELPFRSEADVEVEEGPDFFRFVAQITVPNGDQTADVKAYAVEIHPGVIKIVIGHDDQNHGDAEMELLLDKLEVDKWRFRLPSSSRPELATATFVDGELIVTVPKGGRAGEGLVDGRAVWGGGGRLIRAQ